MLKLSPFILLRPKRKICELFQHLEVFIETSIFLTLNFLLLLSSRFQLITFWFYFVFKKKNLYQKFLFCPLNTSAFVPKFTDNPMELQLSWPSGYYTLYTAKEDGTNVCPQEAGFQWNPGSVTDLNRIIHADNKGNLIGMKAVPSGELRAGVKTGFCSKIQEPGSNYFSQEWPAGKYCILRKSTDPGQGKCPKGKSYLGKRILSHSTLYLAFTR